MTRKLLLVLVGLSTMLAGFAAPAQTRRVATQRVVVQKVDLEGLKGLLARDPKNTRPLLVNFWATW